TLPETRSRRCRNFGRRPLSPDGPRAELHPDRPDGKAFTFGDRPACVRDLRRSGRARSRGRIQSVKLHAIDWLETFIFTGEGRSDFMIILEISVSESRVFTNHDQLWV